MGSRLRRSEGEHVGSRLRRGTPSADSVMATHPRAHLAQRRVAARPLRPRRPVSRFANGAYEAGGEDLGGEIREHLREAMARGGGK